MNDELTIISLEPHEMFLETSTILAANKRFDRLGGMSPFISDNIHDITSRVESVVVTDSVGMRSMSIDCRGGSKEVVIGQDVQLGVHGFVLPDLKYESRNRQKWALNQHSTPMLTRHR